MPKPWELDWSAGAPVPDAMPLPIIPFFGRQRPPMLDDGGAIDPAALASAGAYGMAGADPSTMLPVRGSITDFGGASQIRAAEPPPLSGIDPSIIESAGSSPLLGSGGLGPDPASVLPTAVTSLPAQPLAPQPPALPPAVSDRLFYDAGTSGQPALRSAVLDGWKTAGAQSGSLPQSGPTTAVPAPEMLGRVQSSLTGNAPSDGIPPMAKLRARAQPPMIGAPSGPGRPFATAQPPSGQTPRPTLQSSGERRARSQLGAVAMRFEGGLSHPEPGRVSSGRHDRGGVSYGSFQLSSTEGTAAEFINSPEARAYAPLFANLQPGSAPFSTVWKRVAAQDPVHFEEAQQRFIDRTHYDPEVTRAKQETGLNLEDRSDAVREAAFSVADQHRLHSSAILKPAIQRTDRAFSRTDPRYDQALINNIYNIRTAHVLQRNRDPQIRSSLKRRYRDERGVVLRMLPGS